MHEYVLRVRPHDGEFVATLRPVALHSTVDAVTVGQPVVATAANEFAAMIGAIANAHIAHVPAAVLKAVEAQEPDDTVPCPQEPLSEPTGPLDGMLRELFVLWPAWQEIVGHVSTDDPATACVQSIYGAACAVDRDRLASLLYGRYIGDSLNEAGAILAEVMRSAQLGHRPRTGRELGLTREMFEERS